MARRSPLRATLARPALPPPRLTTDIYETAGGEAYILEIPVPGRTPEDITLEATGSVLTVRAASACARGPDPSADQRLMRSARMTSSGWSMSGCTRSTKRNVCGRPL